MAHAADHPELARARTWAQAHSELLAAAWRAFDAGAEWPELESLQRSFERRGVDVDVAARAWEMPNAVGFVEQERLVLRVRGLSFVPEAGGLLEDWASALALAYRRYVEDDVPTLRGADLREHLGLDPHRADRVSRLLLRESWAFGSGNSVPEGDWEREVRSGARVARGANSAVDILAARAGVEFPVATMSVGAVAQDEPMSFLQVRLALVGRRKWSDDVVLADVDEAWVRERILEPRERGEPITVKGRTLTWDEIESIKITRTDDAADAVADRLRDIHQARSRESGVAVLGGPSFGWRAVDAGADLTDELVTGAPGSRRAPAIDPPVAARGVPEDAARKRRVMVVYGRDGAVASALFDWLRTVDLRPQEWTELVAETGSASPYTGEVLDRAMEIVQAVVVLFTPDDLVRLRDDLLQPHDGDEERELRGQPRPNVLFEAGLAFGRHRDHTVLIEHGELRGLSDLTGRHAVRLSRGVPALQDLAQRLRNAGCAVTTSGDAWLDAARFPDPPDLLSHATAATASTVAAESLPSADGGLGPLERLIAEILAAVLGHRASDDVVAHIASRLRALEGPTRGDELLEGAPGRQLPVKAMKRLMFELTQHGVLRRNPDERVRGYVIGQLP